MNLLILQTGERLNLSNLDLVLSVIVESKILFSLWIANRIAFSVLGFDKYIRFQIQILNLKKIHLYSFEEIHLILFK